MKSSPFSLPCFNRSNDTVALQWQDNSITWAQLQNELNAYLQCALQHDVKTGQIVCLVGKNSIELLYAYLALLKLGATPALIAPQPAVNLAAKLNTLYHPTTQPIIWDFSHQKTLANELDSLTDNRSTWINGKQRINHNGRALGSFPAVQPDSLASIIFTSGSTGEPKAVAHTVQAHVASAAGILQRLTFAGDDSWLLSLPMYHVSGLAIVWRWLCSGAVLRLPSAGFELDIAKVTHASLVATQLKWVLDGNWQTQLKTVLLGGSHIAQELLRACHAKGIETWMGYGLTEMASTVTVKRVEHEISSGKVLPYRHLKIDNQSIYVKGPTLACGYIKQGQLTSVLSDNQDWFDTKDLGYWDRNHELVITGRRDNLFISGGENIHCEEIEAVLSSFVDIHQSIVVPVADEEFGARPVAVIHSDLAIDTLALNQRLSSYLVKYKHPIAYWPMPDHLMSQGIKISRSEVKAWLVKVQSKYVVI